MDRSGAIVDEFECLINPLRDPGPTWLHGLTPSILRDAPIFEDIALHLAALLDGAVVAAHNLSFDRRLLQLEFERAGVDIDWGPAWTPSAPADANSESRVRITAYICMRRTSPSTMLAQRLSCC